MRTKPAVGSAVRKTVTKSTATKTTSNIPSEPAGSDESQPVNTNKLDNSRMDFKVNIYTLTQEMKAAIKAMETLAGLTNTDTIIQNLSDIKFDITCLINKLSVGKPESHAEVLGKMEPSAPFISTPGRPYDNHYPGRPFLQTPEFSGLRNHSRCMTTLEADFRAQMTELVWEYGMSRYTVNQVINQMEGLVSGKKNFEEAKREFTSILTSVKNFTRK